MKIRIEERRNVDLISTLMFLHSGNYPHENLFFEYATKATIKMKIKELHFRLFNQTTYESDETTKTSSDNLNLNDTIDNFMCNNSPRHQLSIDNDIKALEGTKERTERLDNI